LCVTCMNWTYKSMQNTEYKIFSIVIPIFRSELNIPQVLPKLKQLQEMLPDYALEVIFVDDGSPDNSFKLLLDAREKDPAIKLIKFSRNFGVPSGARAGLYYATGDCATFIAPDLQDPPELLVDMLKRWENGKKVVIAVREDREEPLSQKIVSNFFHFLMSKTTFKDYPKGGADLMVLDRDVLDQLNRIGERNTNLLGLVLWLGYEKEYIYYTRKKREHGQSSWTFSKKIKYFIDSFVAFSYAPVRFISLIGICTALLSFVYGALIFIQALQGYTPVQGWSTLMIVLTLLCGIIMIMLGIIGEYLWRILDEVRQRPPYIIEQKLMERS